jgi:hypothetical protein
MSYIFVQLETEVVEVAASECITAIMAGVSSSLAPCVPAESQIVQSISLHLCAATSPPNIEL